MPNQKNSIPDNCLFCQIASKKISAKIIAESPLAVAFLDINPVSDGHTLVIPKSHSIDFAHTTDESLTAVCQLAKRVVHILDKFNLQPWGYNYVSNQGHMAGQQLFHFHMHIIPKYAKNEGYLLKTNPVLSKPIDEVHDQLVKIALKLR